MTLIANRLFRALPIPTSGLIALSMTLATSMQLSTHAHACTCIVQEIGPGFPQTGEVNVPRNPSVFVVGQPVGGLPMSAPVLMHEGGDKIESRSSRLTSRETGQQIDVLLPTEVLPAGTAVSVREGREEVAGGEGADGEEDVGVLLASFVTGNEMDTTPPPVPVVNIERTYSRIDVVSGDTCGNESHGATLSVASEGLFTLVALDPVVELDVDQMDGDLHMILPGSGTTLFIGRGGCISNWPGATGGAEIDLFFATIDGAGNFSGWGEAVEIELPPTTSFPFAPLDGTSGGCSCLAAPSPSSSVIGLALLAFGIVTLRRRRRPGSQTQSVSTR